MVLWTWLEVRCYCSWIATQRQKGKGLLLVCRMRQNILRRCHALSAKRWDIITATGDWR